MSILIVKVWQAKGQWKFLLCSDEKFGNFFLAFLPQDVGKMVEKNQNFVVHWTLLQYCIYFRKFPFAVLAQQDMVMLQRGHSPLCPAWVLAVALIKLSQNQINRREINGIRAHSGSLIMCQIINWCSEKWQKQATFTLFRHRNNKFMRNSQDKEECEHL